MENSTNNNSSKTIRTNDIESPEESSWTMYFEDLLLQKNNEYDSTCSLISDAGSSANAKKSADNEEIARFSRSTCNRLSFKKRKTKEFVLDDALEDTASSPVNSPKVFNVSQLDVKPKGKDDDAITNMFEDKFGSSTSGQIDERREEQLGYDGKESDSTELKKRGLCLVPLSMLVNYLG